VSVRPITLRICVSAAKHDLAMAVTMFVIACTESSRAVLINALSSEAVIGVVPKKVLDFVSLRL